nr:hypothetical protein [Trinickia fusca]
MTSSCLGAHAAAERLLPVTTSWIGNTFGFGDGNWTQIDITAIAVAPDGKVYTDAPWDEAGAEASVYQNGKRLDIAGDTHGWGNHGGNAIAINRRYAFLAVQVGNEKGRLVGEGLWPAKGQQWFGISRRAIGNLKPSVPFQSMAIQAHSRAAASFLTVNEVSVGTPAEIGGLAASETTLYASNTSHDEIDVFDAETMKPKTQWPVHEPGRIALARDGTLWVLADTLTGQAPRAEHYSIEGHRLEDALPLPPDSVAVDITVDKDNRILIADNGPRQQILIFSDANGHGRYALTATLGQRGGIFGGKASEIGHPRPGRFNGLTGVGTDAAGNVYVATNGIGPRLLGTGAGLGAVLQSYAPNGDLRWEVDGLLFVDGACIDPGRPDSVFTGNKRFELDWSKPPGQEWKYVGFLSNRFKYPQDPVFNLDGWPGMPVARRLAGHTFLYLTDMYADHLKIYRFNETRDGETAIPSGLIAGHYRPVDKIPNRPPNGNWIWRDANGNGQFDADEFESDTTAVKIVGGLGWWVDTNGDIWRTSDTSGILRLHFGGLDRAGNPIYSFANATVSPMPEPFSHVRRAIYMPQTDSLYVTGYTNDAGRQPGVSKEVGRVLVRYDAWSSGTPVKRYAITLPWDSSNRPLHLLASLTVEGRYIFAAEVTGTVHVYDNATGAELGVIEPGPEVGHASGWVDVTNGINAHLRKNGEYIVFVEEDARGKVLMYRWRPQ